MALAMASLQPKTTGRIAASHPLDAVFSPKSVAVLGVTATPGTVPYDIFYNILYPFQRQRCRRRAYPSGVSQQTSSSVP